MAEIVAISAWTGSAWHAHSSLETSCQVGSDGKAPKRVIQRNALAEAYRIAAASSTGASSRFLCCAMLTAYAAVNVSPAPVVSTRDSPSWSENLQAGTLMRLSGVSFRSWSSQTRAEPLAPSLNKILSCACCCLRNASALVSSRWSFVVRGSSSPSTYSYYFSMVAGLSF